jgi:hypothetical protein
MYDAGPAEPVAGGQTCLPGPDHQGVASLGSQGCGGCFGGRHGYFPAASVLRAFGARLATWADILSVSVAVGFSIVLLP